MRKRQKLKLILANRKDDLIRKKITSHSNSTIKGPANLETH